MQSESYNGSSKCEINFCGIAIILNFTNIIDIIGYVWATGV